MRSLGCPLWAFLSFTVLPAPDLLAAEAFRDDFAEAQLGSQWSQENVTVGFAKGWVTLSGPNNTLGRIVLQVQGKGSSGSLDLQWPWAFESHLDGPNVDPNITAFKGGIGLRCFYASGQSEWLELGRLAGPGKNVIYSIGAAYRENATANPSLEQADRLYLRIEGVGNDQRSIRLGVRATETDPWVWTLVNTLPQTVTGADYFQLLKHDASHGGLFSPNGAPVTFAFDYARFEGSSFTNLSPWVAPPVDPDLVNQAAQMQPFDLESRAKLAVNGMIGAINPYRRFPYLFAWLTPGIRREASVGVLCGEYSDGLIMARLVSGSEYGLSAEQLMRQSIYDQMAGGFGDSGGGPVIEIAGHKHLLPALLTLARLLPDEARPLQLMRESLSAFNTIALTGQLPDGKPYLYYPVANSVPGPGDYSYINYHRTEGWQGRAKEPIETGSAGFEGAIILPFAQYYDLTRDPLAAEYLDKFIRFILQRAADFNPDGSFTKTDVTNGQVWSRMMTLEGILLYGLSSGRTDLVEWARRAYDQARGRHGTRFGWLPENLAFNHGLGCETDTMTAQIESAFILARRVDDSYWEIAERIALNQLLAQQLVRVDFLQNDLRLLGGFASFCSPQDWWTPAGPYITQSSHGSGMRALYNVWYHAAWWEQGEPAGEAGRTLRVNLHWSKNLPGAQIVSHLPASTRLEINLERPCSVTIRKPDWADSNRIQVEAVSAGGGSTNPVPITVRGRWLDLGHIEGNTRVVANFPDEIVARQDTIRHATQGNVIFTTQWRGNVVVEIQPRGLKQPNYDGREGRDPYVARFTASQALDPIFMRPLENTAGLRSELPKVSPPVALHYELSNQQLVLSWTASGWFLQENQELSNASGWVAVPGGLSSPLKVSVGSRQKFYRLKKF